MLFILLFTYTLCLSMPNTLTYPITSLQPFTQHVFEAMGCPPSQARTAADVLLQADLRGIDSHGIARLSGYVRLWQKKRINAQPNMQVVHETPSTATLDADQALGLVSAPYGMQLAIEKAQKYGSGWVAIRNSNHFGIAAYHALLAIPHQMIGFATTNASALVAPTHANERLLGTNPLCWVFPAGNYPPVVVDMATSFASNGKLEIAQRKAQSIPSEWATDANGQPTTNAHALQEGGMLTPLGNYKGFGLSTVADLLSGVLSGANYGPWVPPFVSFLEPLTPPVGAGIGHLVGAWRVDAFRPLHEFLTHIDTWIARFKAARTTSNQSVIIPGEPEFAHEQHRRIHGIPLQSAVVADLLHVAETFKLPAPRPC